MTVDSMLGVKDFIPDTPGCDITDYAINALINFITATPLLSSRNVNFTAYCREHDYCAESLQYYMLQLINKESLKDIKRIERNTKSHDKLWYKTRSSRITASICHNAVRTTSSGKFADSFLKKHIRCTAIFNDAIKWGLSHEAIAKKKYTEVTGNQMEECGIFIHPDLNFLAATPDGINRNKNLIIEIKCPYSVRNALPINAKYITKHGLSKTHSYQIQSKHPKCHNPFSFKFLITRKAVKLNATSFFNFRIALRHTTIIYHFVFNK